eukprot:350348-Chlamydomonas_euryale.AAC.5
MSSCPVHAQVLANTLYAVGKLQLPPAQRDASLIPAVLAASRLRLSLFTPQVGPHWNDAARSCAGPEGVQPAEPWDRR